MFIYRGGQTVKKGTYWEPEKGTKIVVDDSGLLPGDRGETYFRFPESYLLIPILLLGLALSMALPYGAGFLLFFSADFATQLSLDERADMITTFGGHPNQFRFQHGFTRIVHLRTHQRTRQREALRAKGLAFKDS